MAEGVRSPEQNASLSRREAIVDKLLTRFVPAKFRRNKHVEGRQSSVLEPPANERIYVIPNEMFIRDELSEAKAPELIRGVRQYRLENFLELLPLAKRLGEIKENKALNKLGFGNGGFVFQFKSQGMDLAIKLLYSENLSRNTLEHVLDEIGVNAEDKIEIQARYANQRHIEDDALNEVAGFELGHAIAPEYVDKPECVFTLNGEPVGFAVPTIYGEGTDIGSVRRTVSDPDLDRVWKRLTNGGVGVDIVGNNNAVKYLDNGVERVKFVDLAVDDDTMERDPRKLRPGEFWVKRLEAGRETSFGMRWMDYKSIAERINLFEVQYNEVLSGARVYTFDDVLEGVAYKTNKATYEAYKKEVQQFHNFVAVLRDRGVMPDQPGVALRILKSGDRAEVFYAKNAWLNNREIENQLSNSGRHIAQEFRASYDGDSIGTRDYEFHQREYTGLNVFNDLDISFKDGRISYKLVSANGGSKTAKILSADERTGSYKYFQGGDVRDPELIELTGEVAQRVIQDIQYGLGIDTISLPEKTLGFIYEKMRLNSNDSLVSGIIS